ncbi:unnamed protein product [Brassicogethes aeneus]|uniref:MGA conserved domain-containing protein n=1 Tax=Brassicogethes aeneus TaxID=1431903 RepID=A0A9P0B9L0_BRAAE|nr:unnamed protein product [Brassicogethes aeneus]
MDNALKNFLKTTGWSPEDLLQKLAQYKSNETQNIEETANKTEQVEEKTETSEESTSPIEEEENAQEADGNDDDDDEYEEDVSNCSSNSSGVFTSDLNENNSEENLESNAIESEENSDNEENNVDNLEDKFEEENTTDESEEKKVSSNNSDVNEEINVVAINNSKKFFYKNQEEENATDSEEKEDISNNVYTNKNILNDSVNIKDISNGEETDSRFKENSLNNEENKKKFNDTHNEDIANNEKNYSGKNKYNEEKIEDISCDSENKEDSFNEDEPIEDTRHDKFFDSDEKEEEIEETTTESIEDIRNNLKLQLSSLRNRKKQHVIQEVTTKIVEANKIEEKKLIEPPPIIEEKEEDLISQTNELGLVILNVEGGVDFDETATKERFEFEEDLSEDDEDEEEKSETSVFAEIRKIIGKPRNKSKLKMPSTNFVKPMATPVATVNVSSIKKIQEQSTEQSPFVSDELDKFLTAGSNLNISYNVPKSGAEEGLIDQYRAESPIQEKSNESTDIKLKETKKEEEDILQMPKIKAKTLAEKRKLLEKHLKKDVLLRKSLEMIPSKEEPPLLKKAREEILLDDDITINSLLSKSFEKKEKRSIPPKQKKYYHQNLKMKAESMYQTITPAVTSKPKIQPGFLQSKERSLLKPIIRRKAIMYNGEKVYVASESGKLICNIKDSIAIKAAKRKKLEEQIKLEEKIKLKEKIKLDEKPELNKKMSLWYNKKQKIHYKPGPLSKKMKLEINPCNDFKTDIKKLPRPILEVVPSYGRPMDPKIIHLLPKSDGKITDFQIEFALAALKPQKKEAMTIFGIQVPYEHKERNILVKIKKQPKKEIKLEELKEDEKRNNIESIIDDLITYVETKEIEGSLYKVEEKEESDINQEHLEAEKELSPLIHKRQRKSKVAWELQRLSCKVVNVKENNIDIVCYKSHCNLGCLCNSLNSDRYIATHCKKEECMFECTCPKKELPNYGDEKIFSSGGILSNDTVHQIDETAKKDLAKVEKEFTHTVICTDNKAIVLGAGDRKLKRLTKAPKKYEDYIESTFIEETEDNPPSVGVSYDFPPCFLQLQKLNLSGVVPFCMDHSRYKCDCIYVSSSECKLIRIQKALKVKDFDCARFRTAYHYVKRNKNKNYNRFLMSLLKEKEKLIADDDYYVNIYSTEFPKPLITDAEILKEALEGLKSNILKIHHAKANNNVFIESPRATKRKQSFSQIFTDEHDKAIQRRKKIRPVLPTPEPIFDGEVLVNDKNSELLKHLEASQIGFARLLPWKALQDSFIKGKVKLWTQASKMRKLYINTFDKVIPDGCFDIRIYTPDIDVCRWLLTNKLPEKYHPENISFILRETKCGNFEVCGICNRHVEGLKPDVETVEDDVYDEDLVTTLSHKDKDNALRVLLEKTLDCERQNLLCENQVVSKLYLVQAKIPDISINFRWRMLTLKSDFTYLHFKNNEYSIKYTILSKTLERAIEKQQTIVLKSSLLCKGYHHRDFGIYFPPDATNNIFIGPYMFYEDHKLETLRYISQCLVDTESYNKIQGNKLDAPNSHWVHHNSSKVRTKYPTITKPIIAPEDPAPVVDLTSDTEDEPNTSQISTIDKVVVLEGVPKQPEEFNRYIISNIPNFGYVGAYLHESTGQIDVSWPFEKKILRFNNNDQAVSFLETRFSHLLITIPSDFNITMTIVEELDLQFHKAMDPRCLIGHYICGRFGAYDAKKITEEEAMTLCGVSRNYIYQMLKKRANQLVIANMQAFAKSLNLFEGELKSADVTIVLERACDTIRRLRKEEVELLRNKLVLENRKRVLNERAQGLIYETNNVKKTDVIEEGSIRRSTVRKKSRSEIPKTGGFTISTDEVRQKSAKQLQSTQNMKSILKTCQPPFPYKAQTKNTQPKILSGVKIVKSADGKLFLVSKNKNTPIKNDTIT